MAGVPTQVCGQGRGERREGEGRQRRDPISDCLVEWPATACTLCTHATTARDSSTGGRRSPHPRLRPQPRQPASHPSRGTARTCRSYRLSGMYCVYDLLKTQTSPLAVGRGTPWPL